jgi:hypothetical protein
MFATRAKDTQTCLICNVVTPYHGSPTNMKKHLGTHMNAEKLDEIAKRLHNLWSSAGSLFGHFPKKANVAGVDVLKYKTVEEATQGLSEAIILDKRPFTLFDGELGTWFKRAFGTPPPHRQTISRRADTMFTSMQEHLRLRLQPLTFAALSFDFWTCKQTTVSFGVLLLNAPNGRPHSLEHCPLYCLAATKISKAHTGEELAAWTDKALTSVNLSPLLHETPRLPAAVGVLLSVATTDLGANGVKAVGLLGLMEKPCDAHNLHNALLHSTGPKGRLPEVTDILKSTEPLRKLLKKSSKVSLELKSLVEAHRSTVLDVLLGFKPKRDPSKQLPNTVNKFYAGRWGDIAKLLKRLLVLRQPLLALMKSKVFMDSWKDNHGNQDRPITTALMDNVAAILPPLSRISDLFPMVQSNSSSFGHSFSRIVDTARRLLKYDENEPLERKVALALADAVLDRFCGPSDVDVTARCAAQARLASATLSSLSRDAHLSGKYVERQPLLSPWALPSEAWAMRMTTKHPHLSYLFLPNTHPAASARDPQGQPLKRLIYAPIQLVFLSIFLNHRLMTAGKGTATPDFLQFLVDRNPGGLFCCSHAPSNMPGREYAWVAHHLIATFQLFLMQHLADSGAAPARAPTVAAPAADDADDCIPGVFDDVSRAPEAPPVLAPPPRDVGKCLPYAWPPVRHAISYPWANEFTVYFGMLKTMSTADCGKQPLVFWMENQAKFPLLSMLAELLECIPTSAAECERAWSKAGLLSTDQRARLNADKLGKMVELGVNKGRLD